MSSAQLLRYEFLGDRVEPLYLDGSHTEIVRGQLRTIYYAFRGKRLKQLLEALRVSPAAAHQDQKLVAGLLRVIDESLRLTVEAPAEPQKIREAVFSRGRRELDLSREDALLQAADKLGIPSATLSDHLDADLRPERRVNLPPELPPVAEILSRYNFRLLQGLLLQSLRVRIDLHEQAHAVYRAARLQGLLVEVKRGSTAESPLRLEVTGPLSLFQRTRKYGISLAHFVPACCTASRYRLEALLNLRGRQAILVATEADRVLSSQKPPRSFDSKLEKRFHRDFVGLGSRWDIQRDAQLISFGDTVFLPDFTFRLRSDPGIAVDLEIVGFWTRDYLARKRALFDRLRKDSGRRPLIVCVDRTLCCDRESSVIPFVQFSRRVPAERVLEELDRVARRLNRRQRR